MPRKVARLLGILAVLGSAAVPASAQVVNIQPVLGQGFGEDGWAGNVKASLVWRTGNTDLFLASTSLLTRYQIEMHRLVAMGSFDVGYQDGFDKDDAVILRGFGHVRWQWNVLEWLTPEVFGQLAADEFLGLSLRAVVGAGPRFDLVSGPAVNAAVAIAYIYEREHLGSRAGLDAGKKTDNHRAQIYLSGSFAIAPLLSIAHTTYYQMLLTDPLDFRILSETSLIIKLTEMVSLSVDFLLAYDSKPPDQVEDLDTGLTVGVGVSF